MNINKKFNAWISRNFKGLSAHTLYQFLCTECFYMPTEASNTVYADIYAVFCNNANDDQRNIFANVQMFVGICEWL